MVKNTYFDFDVTFYWSAVNLNATAVFVDSLHGAVENFIVKRFERNYVKAHLKDDITGGVLVYSLQIILLL